MQNTLPEVHAHYSGPQAAEVTHALCTASSAAGPVAVRYPAVLPAGPVCEAASTSTSSCLHT
jgi:hypothetical protein